MGGVVKSEKTVLALAERTFTLTCVIISKGNALNVDCAGGTGSVSAIASSPPGRRDAAGEAKGSAVDSSSEMCACSTPVLPKMVGG